MGQVFGFFVPPCPVPSHANRSPNAGQEKVVPSRPVPSCPAYQTHPKRPSHTVTVSVGSEYIGPKLNELGFVLWAFGPFLATTSYTPNLNSKNKLLVSSAIAYIFYYIPSLSRDKIITKDNHAQLYILLLGLCLESPYISHHRLQLQLSSPVQSMRLTFSCIHWTLK